MPDLTEVDAGVHEAIHEQSEPPPLLHPSSTDVSKKVGRPNRAGRPITEILITSDCHSLSSEPDHDTESIIKSPKTRKKPVSTFELFKREHIGQPLERIPSARLPTKRVILQKYQFLKDDSLLTGGPSRSDKDIANAIVDRVIFIWASANIPVVRRDYILRKVSIVIDELISLKKRGSRVKSDKEPAASFIVSLDELFDISVDDLKYRLSTGGNPDTWKVDWLFYQNQCKH
jgi:hypothetical protein